MVPYLFCFITILFFSTLEVVGKLIGANISPASVTVYRFIIGAIVLAPIAFSELKKKSKKLNFREIAGMTIPGILNVAVSMYLLQISVFYGKAFLSAIIISTNPVFTTIFAHFILKEKMSAKVLIAQIVSILALVGIVLMEKDLFSGSRDISLGIIFAILAAVSFALYTVLSKRQVKTHGSIVFNSVSFFGGALILAAFTLIQGGSLSFTPNPGNLMLLLYLGIFVTGIAYYLFFQALKKIPASVGASFFFLKPVIAGLLAFLILGERMHNLQALFYLVIVMAQLYIVFSKKRVKQA